MNTVYESVRVLVRDANTPFARIDGYAIDTPEGWQRRNRSDCLRYVQGRFGMSHLEARRVLGSSPRLPIDVDQLRTGIK